MQILTATLSHPCSRHCSITAKRDDARKHDLYDLTAFNTDGQPTPRRP
jgi:hypothetical protein